MQKVSASGTNSKETDTLAYAAFARCRFYFRGEPCRFSHQYQILLELRVGLHQAGKRTNQPDMIFSRLDITYGENKWTANVIRSRTLAAAASCDMGRYSGDAARGTTVTLFSFSSG